MPDPNRLLNTIFCAIEACKSTAGRRGRFVQLQNVDEVFVTGDLHGNVENLRKLLKMASLEAHPMRHFVLQEVIHGPHRYPTGGDKSHQVLDVFVALKRQFPQQVHLLPGNHEIAQWTGLLIGKDDWDLNALFCEGIESAYGSMSPRIYEGYLKLFAALPFALRTPNRVFLSHSLPNSQQLGSFSLSALEREELDEQELHRGGSAFSLVWGRDLREDHVQAFLAMVDADWLISGHVPCEDGFELPNSRQIVLDSQAFPAAYCLFPTTRPLEQQQLVDSVHLL